MEFPQDRPNTDPQIPMLSDLPPANMAPRATMEPSAQDLPGDIAPASQAMPAEGPKEQGRRAPSRLSRHILELGVAVAEEEADANLGPVEQKVYDAICTDSTLTTNQLASSMGLSPKSVGSAKDRLVKKLLGSLPEERKAAEIRRMEEEDQAAGGPRYELKHGVTPSINSVRTMGALFTAEGVDPAIFLSRDRRKVFAGATNHPNHSFEELARTLHMSVPDIKRTFREMLITLAGHLPKNIPIPSSLGLELIHPYDAETTGVTAPGQGLQKNTGIGPTPVEVETTASQDPANPEKVLVTLVEAAATRIPAKWLGYHLARLDKAVVDAKAHVTFSPTEQKLLEALHDDPFVSDADLSMLCDMAQASIPRFKSRLMIKLKGNLSGEYLKNESDHMAQILARPTYDVAPHKSAVNAVRSMEKVLAAHEIDPRPFLSEHYRSTLEAIVLNPNLGSGSMADLLDTDRGNFIRLCKRMIKKLSFLIPEEAEVPPILRRSGPDHNLARNVGNKLLGIILERSIGDIASQLRIGETALKNFLTGEEVSSADAILVPLIRHLGLTGDAASELYTMYTASIPEEDPKDN